MKIALTIIFFIMVFYASVYTMTHSIIPFITKKGMKRIEKNPKWITSAIRDKYYGFHDIDFILTDSKYGGLPYFNLSKHTHHIEVLIPTDTSTNEIENIAKLALSSKIKAKCGLQFSNKPLYWLSILCYLLDGGDIQIEATKWETTKDNKPVDF